MNREFNPLESCLLFARPERLHPKSAWIEHTPFAMMLVELLRPRVIVELGTQYGISHCAFCQAVSTLGLPAKCYAVDTWKGDPNAGFYGEAVYTELNDYHRRYESFAKLLRMTFDQALSQIPDGAVDLLHIDGCHSYEAVKHDYDTWLPKVSQRGIILFHDTMVTLPAFGVHQFWKELSAGYPSFNFEHGYGLGVLAVGKEQPEPVKTFFDSARNHPLEIRKIFSALGHQIQCQYEKQIAPPGLVSKIKKAVKRLVRA